MGGLRDTLTQGGGKGHPCPRPFHGTGDVPQVPVRGGGGQGARRTTDGPRRTLHEVGRRGRRRCEQEGVQSRLRTRTRRRGAVRSRARSEDTEYRRMWDPERTRVVRPYPTVRGDGVDVGGPSRGNRGSTGRATEGDVFRFPLPGPPPKPDRTPRSMSFPVSTHGPDIPWALRPLTCVGSGRALG